MISRTIFYACGMQVRNFRAMLTVHVAGAHAVRRVFLVLRSLLAPGGPNEIPRRFSSLPLFFASGRFATFFFLPGRRTYARWSA